MLAVLAGEHMLPAVASNTHYILKQESWLQEKEEKRKKTSLSRKAEKISNFGQLGFLVCVLFTELAHWAYLVSKSQCPSFAVPLFFFCGITPIYNGRKSIR